MKYVPPLDKVFRARKRPVGSSWRMDETYVKVKGSLAVLCIEPSTKPVTRWTFC